MTLEENILEKLQSLGVEKQLEVLDFIEFLLSKKIPNKEQRITAGMFSDLNVHISEEDIDEARREMWNSSTTPHGVV